MFLCVFQRHCSCSTDGKPSSNLSDNYFTPGVTLYLKPSLSHLYSLFLPFLLKFPQDETSRGKHTSYQKKHSKINRAKAFRWFTLNAQFKFVWWFRIKQPTLQCVLFISSKGSWQINCSVNTFHINVLYVDISEWWTTLSVPEVQHVFLWQSSFAEHHNSHSCYPSYFNAFRAWMWYKCLFRHDR